MSENERCFEMEFNQTLERQKELTLSYNELKKTSKKMSKMKTELKDQQEEKLLNEILITFKTLCKNDYFMLNFRVNHVISAFFLKPFKNKISITYHLFH